MSGAAVASSRRPMPPGRLALPSPSQRRLLAVAALAAAVAYLSRVWSVKRAAGVVLVRGLLGVQARDNARPRLLPDRDRARNQRGRPRTSHHTATAVANFATTETTSKRRVGNYKACLRPFW